MKAFTLVALLALTSISSVSFACNLALQKQGGKGSLRYANTNPPKFETANSSNSSNYETSTVNK
ncbi:MAG: hypothetical protein WA160_05260 [Pseudobdellovibrio sp.]